MTDGLNGLKRLRDEGGETVLSTEDAEGLEAIILTDGSRPTLRLAPDNTVNLEHKLLGDWRRLTTQFQEEIRDVSSAVGRVDKAQSHMGTAFVVGADLILTNRHVLQEVGTQTSNGGWEISGASVAFDVNPQDTRKREFKLKQVVRAGSRAIDFSNIDFEKLDFAVMQVERTADDGFPAPLVLGTAIEEIGKGKPIYTVGYPGKPKVGAYAYRVLRLLFSGVYGVKRFAPGEIDEDVGQVGTTVFEHDTTTLGGNSGSCIVDFENGSKIVGLHFAGSPAKANYAHANALLRDALKNLDINWQAPSIERA